MNTVLWALRLVVDFFGVVFILGAIVFCLFALASARIERRRDKESDHA